MESQLSVPSEASVEAVNASEASRVSVHIHSVKFLKLVVEIIKNKVGDKSLAFGRRAAV